MGLIKRVQRSEKRIVERRSEDVTPKYCDWGSGPKQSEAPGCLNSGGENLRPARRSVGEVTLRDHRLMNYRTLANWPPIWTRRGRNNGAAGEAVPVRARRREIGILKEALISAVTRPPRIYLIVTDDGHEYIGSLLFNDSAFCREIYALLKRHCGKTIAEIGSLDVSYLD
jgi:hypothetical protein